MKDITVILNVYNRCYTLEDQLKSLYEQTVRVPDENIWIWYNKGENSQASPINKNHKIFVCNHNTKFHGRFAAANLAQTKYIAMFDDDVIPGKNWLSNCLHTMELCDGILGGSGVLLRNKFDYQIHQKFGWNGIQTQDIMNVDLVGHAWFFKQEWTKYMWFEKPVSWDNGEDIMFSYLCKKYGNVNTFVSPHPQNDMSVWCNVAGNKFGSDSNATYINKSDHYQIRSRVCTACIDNGWKTVLEL